MSPFRIVHGGETPPKAVVVLYGWYNAPLSVVQKYSRLYQIRGCVTITGVVGPFVCLTNSDEHYDEFIRSSIHHAAAILRENPGIPLLVHCFSNAGCRALHRLEIALETRSDESDVALIKNSMKAQIFDSAPAAVAEGKPFNVRSWRSASPHACIWVNLFGLTSDLVDNQRARLRHEDEPETEYWKAIANSKLCDVQAFLYSHSDNLCDVEKLEKLIETRREQGVDVLAVKFENSLHVNHLKWHETEYETAMITMLRKAGAVGVR